MSSPVHKDKGTNMVAADEDEESLEERLSKYRQPLRQPFIYRVQSYLLRGSNDNVHEPRMLAIGPYHHGKQSLKMMEEHKLSYLKSLLLRRNESVDRYVLAITEIEEEARSCYVEELSLSKTKFIEMLVMDGCFIVELLLKFQGRIASCASDPIILMKWFKQNLMRDLVLLENQIPFFVLCKLYGLINEGGASPNQQQQLIESISRFLELVPIYRIAKIKTEEEEVMHLLHLKHATERPSSPIYIKLERCPSAWEFHWIPSATELKDANVTFCKPQDSSIPFEVDFSNGVLTMSTLTIQDETDCDLRNLILYEQYFPGDQPTYVTDYLVVLDCLVNTGRDVEILSQYGIVRNMTGHNQMAADIINRLAQSVMLSQAHFIYCNTFKQINAHHKRRWNKARAILNRDYFNSPWAYVSIFAALFLLLLTMAQTIISAIQLRKDIERKTP